MKTEIETTNNRTEKPKLISFFTFFCDITKSLQRKPKTNKRTNKLPKKEIKTEPKTEKYGKWKPKTEKSKLI